MRKVSTPKILFIEDDSDCWLIIKKVLAQWQSRISPVCISSCEQALSQFLEWELQEWELPKLIFLDLYLPQAKQGWTVLEHLKTRPGPIQQIPIIIISNSSSKQDIRKAYQLGASSYLIKPTSYDHWVTSFDEIRTYWLETASLPRLLY